ncbi:dicarboxylate/amino acid:cation symporter [Enterococcus quebecensis]|nr:dicarboxylate/amino acid:cation symporter [Enterococcus quebecensis]
MKFIKNYQSSLKLLAGIAIGAIIGIFFSDFALLLEPLGRLFLNVVFVLIVPLVFCNMTLAVANNQGLDRIKKILRFTLVSFLLTTLTAVVLMYLATLIYNPFETIDTGQFTELMDQTLNADSQSLAMVIVDTLTVSNFLDLFDKSHLLSLILFSLFFGLTISSVGEKAVPLTRVITSVNHVIMKMITLVMRFAPVGLGSYFAYTLGNLGSKILGGYFKSLILFVIVCVIYYVFILSIYAYIGGGTSGLKCYWKNIFNPSLQALGTSSSAACIPVNLTALERIGVPEDIRETVISLGANIHKDGSAMSGVLQVVLLFTLFNRELDTPLAALCIIGGGFLVGVVMGSIPSGGFTAEVLLVSLFGFPVEVIPVLAVITTITDMTATVINSTSNITCGMMVRRAVEKTYYKQTQLPVK